MTIGTSLEDQTKARQYKPVHRCIYCGAYSNNLQLEHIVPFGLAGNALRLPKSSCTACASITAKFEQACLRKMFGPLRIRIGAPTRRKKERPKILDLTHVKRNPWSDTPVTIGVRSISAEEHPLIFVCLRLREPGILKGAQPSNTIDGSLYVCRDEKEEKKLFADQNIQPDEGFKVGEIETSMFCRLIAKIAYGYAVAEFGYGSFKPIINDFILGKTDHPSHLVGGDFEIPPPTQNLYELRSRPTVVGGVVYIVISVRLFAFMGGPQYHVVVGTE